MSYYLESEEPFIKKMTSLKMDAIYSSKVKLTRFLNMREQELLKSLVSKSDPINLFFYESNLDLEYKRALITPFTKNLDFKVTILKLIYNPKYLEINHRMILGALMNLGIERDLIGDILISKNKNCYIFCASEIVSFIKLEFRILHHQSVEFEEVDEILDDVEANYDEMKCFVSSLRIDLLISQRFNISREKSTMLVKKGFVKINQMEMTNNSHLVNENDLISVKGYGRMKLLSVGGLSKSNKIFVNLGLLK